MDTKLDARALANIKRIEERVFYFCDAYHLSEETKRAGVKAYTNELIEHTDFFTGEEGVKIRKRQILEGLKEALPQYPLAPDGPETVGEYKF